MINAGIVGRGNAKWWYCGCFRRERPQKGRYRQFTQFGVDFMAKRTSGADLELILLSHHVLGALELAKHTHLHINYLPQADARAAYIKNLQAFLESHTEQLPEDVRQRLKDNPLRVLDSKDPNVIAILADAPQLSSYLSTEERTLLKEIDQVLAANHIKFTWDPLLVRGLDYYAGIVFEWQSTLLGAQSAVCGGGRYDQLSTQLGAKPWPATGLSFGIDRLVLMCQHLKVNFPEKASIALINDGADLTKLFATQRSWQAQFAITTHIDHNAQSVKKAIQRAQKQGHRFALILKQITLF